MSDCGDDCNCAACSTLVMGPNPEWKPVLVTVPMIRRCCFCRGDRQVHHFTALAMPVCCDCAKQFEPATKTEQVTEYSVKIWYRSGAYEGAPHCPEELARKIYADAVQSAGVEFAELHGPSGMLVESKPRTEENTSG